MHGRIPGCLEDRRYWLLPLLPWTAAIVWSAQKDPAQAVIHLLTLVVCGGLLEQLRRCWLELDAGKDEVDTLGRQLLQSERMVSLGRLVAGFAHEINTPIGIAVGAITNCEETLDGIERLLDGEEVSEEDLRAALSTLRQGGALAVANLRRAASLNRSFKRTAIDQSADDERTFVVSELIDDVLRNLQHQLQRVPVAVAVDCPQGVAIHGVPGRLEQLLTNLVMNSVTHGFGEAQRPGRITIGVALDNGRLRLDYADNGVGMAADVLLRIFEPFFTTRREQGGSGLGLHICHTIATVQLGGTMRCESRPGEGTRFLVDFPVKESEVA